MRVHYVSCFSPNDSAEKPLRCALQDWKDQDGSGPTIAAVSTPDELRQHLTDLDKAGFDVLIVGGHGHKSLSGFLVRKEAVQWHDLAFLLRGAIPITCTFIFYSCDGAYPGIAHMFGRASGPDLVFGPRIKVLADAMTHATVEILNWKMKGGGDDSAARKLVDTINAWAKTTYPNSQYDHKFLRVMWCEGPRCRHPEEPGHDKPIGGVIPSRGWGL